MGQVIAIAAVADNGVIGNRGRLPWNIPEDLKRFKRLTTGNMVLMGRKTFESLKCKPLPERLNVVVSKSLPQVNTGNLLVTEYLYETIDHYRQFSDKDLYIIGGGEIYDKCLHLLDKMELTRVFGNHKGDTYFPAFYSSQFQMTDWDSSVVGCRFESYQRKF